jgi:non-ribosomal peptide synthetase component F
VRQGEGELLVRSRFLADGYWRRDLKGDFTADAIEPGARCFRTGDLVRIAADGGFEFLGRRDDQVLIKVRRQQLDRAAELVAKAAGPRNPAARGRVYGTSLGINKPTVAE